MSYNVCIEPLSDSSMYLTVLYIIYMIKDNERLLDMTLDGMLF